MRRQLLLSLVGILVASTKLSAETVIPLTGTSATEASGDCIAFNIPNFDSIGTAPGGEIIWNELAYPPLPFDPADPTAPLDPDATFNMGTLTYDESLLGGAGEEFMAVDAEMFSFDFASSYSLAIGIEVDVRPPTLGGANVELTDIAGPGLKFVDGSPVALDFTANVEWTPTFNGFNQTLTPYTGTLKVVDGTFFFDLSDQSLPWPFWGAGEVDFVFDLIATVDSLSSARYIAMPELSISRAAAEVTIEAAFDQCPNASYQLESSPNLSADSWVPEGDIFSHDPSTWTFPLGAEARFFRVRCDP